MIRIYGTLGPACDRAETLEEMLKLGMTGLWLNLSHGSLEQAAGELARGGVGTVVVSLGGDGALFVTGDQALRGYGLRVPVQSTVGAGDSMMAAMAHGAARGMRFRDTCALAMAVSAAAVTTPGTQPAEMQLVNELLKQVRIEEV